MKTQPAVVPRKGFLFGLVAGLIGVASSHGQQMAFPGALGFGAYATGGRGGTVYHVSNLNDSGAGSFRDAVSEPNRIVVFDVGGYINLLSAVSASSSLTIAGQTAPGGGIGLMGAELSFYNQTNIICRHLRVCQGGSSTSQSGINIGSSSGQAGNMIFDHVSVEFGQWDSVDAVNTENFTVQNCIIADPINQQFGAHVEGGNASYCNNLWVNAHNRQPLAKANTVYVNNVVYDYQAGYTTADTAGVFSHDIVNNYFIAGPSTTNPNDDFFQFDSGQTVYAVGNLLDSSRNGTLTGSPTAPGGDTPSSTPWSPVTAAIPTVSAQNAFRIDISRAGAFPSDQLDQQVISQVASLGASGSLITSPANTGLANSGYGTIDGGTPLLETDGDGIPDIWKNAVGLPLATNEAMTIAANGYANIENYLNWIAGPHAFVSTNATVIDLWPYTLGFTNDNPAYAFSNVTNGSVTLTNAHYAYFVPTPGFTGLAGFNFAVTGGDGSAMTNTMGLLVSVTYVPKNLVWRGDGVANIWDVTNSANWVLNGDTLATFNNTDNVIFDDTGSAGPAINIDVAVAPGSVAMSANQNYTLAGSGAMTGPASFTKSGAGTLLVDNNNSLAGPLTVNGGVIEYNNGASLGSGNIILNGGTLSYALSGGSTYLTVANNISIAPGPANTIIMSQRDTMSGTVTNSGSLNLVAPSTLGGTRDYLSGSWSQFAGSLNISGGGALDCQFQGGAFDGFNSANLTISNETLGVYGTPDGETINIGALSGNSGAYLFGSGQGYGGLVTWLVGDLDLNSSFAGSIQNGGDGPTALTKVGTGALTLSGSSTYTGNTVVSNGTLYVAGSLNNSPVTVASGATLGGTGFLGGGLTVLSGGTIAPSLENGGAGALIVSNNLTLNSSATMNFDLSSSPGGSNDEIIMQGGLLTMGNPQNYNFNLVNNALGAGTYNLITGGANTSAASVGFASNLPGNTRQTFAFLRPASGNGQCYVQLAVTGNAGSLVWQGTNGNNWDNVTTNWLNGTAADKFYNLDLVRFDDTAGSGNVSIIGEMQPASVLVTNSMLPYTISNGVLAGITSLTKAGPGMLTLSSSNSFTGGAFVYGGTLQLVNNLYAGGAGPITLNGGTLYLNGVGTGTTITTVGNNTLQTYGQPYASFNLQGSGLLNLNIGGGGVFSPSGNWSAFTGALQFTTANWVRYINAEFSTTVFGSSNAVWNLGSAGGLYNKYGNVTVYLGALSGGASAALSGASTSPAGVTTYAVGGINTNSIFDGVISDGAAAATALVFNGPGSLTLAGDNTFSGGVTANAGTLFVNNLSGSGTGSGVVTINNGATLGGVGTIGGVVTVSGGGTLSPGDSNPGTLAINNDLSLNNASVSQFALGTNSDQVMVSGDLTLGGTLNFSNAGGFGPGTYTLFTYGGALSVGTVTIGNVPSACNCRIDSSMSGQVNLIVSLPQFGGISITPAGLVASGSNGPANGNYFLLSATNLAQPMNSWTRVLTNHFDDSGNFILTNAVGSNAAQMFFRLQSQ